MNKLRLNRRVLYVLFLVSQASLMAMHGEEESSPMVPKPSPEQIETHKKQLEDLMLTVDCSKRRSGVLVVGRAPGSFCAYQQQEAVLAAILALLEKLEELILDSPDFVFQNIKDSLNSCFRCARLEIAESYGAIVDREFLMSVKTRIAQVREHFETRISTLSR